MSSGVIPSTIPPIPFFKVPIGISPRVIMKTLSTIVPPLISMASTSLATSGINILASSRLIPSSQGSSTEILVQTSISGPTASLTARKVSSKNLNLFSGVPPHASVRLLVCGERNCASR
ncbi:hypothetical protein D3C85_1556720 [compost metagenome]